MSDVTSNNVPSVQEILVSMDCANRDEQEELQNTMKALIKRAELDDVDPEDYLKLAILVAFRRRNHLKSMAGGIGAGEKRILLTILHQVSAVKPELVARVLPLVPMYGSWRDVRLLGDLVYDKPSSNYHQVRASVTSLFASQLRRDLEAAGLPLDGNNPASQDQKKRAISLACKYAPSSSRHRGSKKTRTEGPSSQPNASVVPSGKGSGRGGKGKGKGKGKGNGSTEAAANREVYHESQSAMADEVATKLGLRPTHLKADFRKLVVSPLNNKLTEEGYLIERLMVERRCSEIKFRRAGKAALTKYKAAINKDPVAARRWKSIMNMSANAIPDIDDLVVAATSFLDVSKLSLDDDEVVMSHRAISKAVTSAVEERQRLGSKASKLLAQLSQEKDSSDAIMAATCALESVEVPCLAVVDLATATSREHATALLLGAFITMRAQETEGLLPLGSGAVVVHFDSSRQSLITLPCSQSEADGAAEEEMVDDDGVAKTTAAAEDTAQKENPPSSRVDGDDFAEFFKQVEAVGALSDASNQPLNVQSLRAAASLTLNDVEVDIHATSAFSDVLVLCGNFVAGTDEEIEPTIRDLKESTTNQLKLRALLVHRCKPALKNQGKVTVPFVPRRGLRSMPSNPAEVVVDICFLMDLTASMSSWMSACKQHLRDIINGLKDETGVGKFRVAFVGYRDYRDSDRVVSIDFKPIDQVQAVVDFIANEAASGGADEPEDVIIGLETVKKMSWKGHVRMCIHVADATGHGLTKSLGYCSDDYPRGTPDQKHTTEAIAGKLANALHGPGVDMLFCQLNDRTVDLEAVYAQVWGGQGFGVLPLLTGSQAFKQAVLSTLSASILGLITPEMSSVQTFDGATLSAALSALNANYKESLQHAAQALADHLSEKRNCIAAAAAEATTVEASPLSSDVRHEDVEVETASDAAAERDAVGAEEPSNKTKESKVEAVLEARGDYERLMSDLEGEDLVPVRIALQMPSGNGGVLGISEIAARTLLENGITLAEVNSAGYPSAIVDVFNKVGGDMVRRIA